ncbi:hypothetical protein NUACC21_40190 [Scytonema sp. NUACC21]
MKCSLGALLIVLGAIALAPSAYANQENTSTTTTDRGQASLLLTKPASIKNQAGSTIYRINNRRPAPVSIGVKREQQCKNINPLDFFKDPAANLKLCSKPQQPQNLESKPTEPANYYKVPPLESGIRVPLSNF